MVFHEAPLPGAMVIEIEEHPDDRGSFSRLFCEREFARLGLASRIVQINDSVTRTRGTLRGLHYQLAPRAETKVVRCVRGAIHDVLLDLRRGSPTFGRSFGVELSADNRRMVYAPKGFAHGFITLTDDVETLYLTDEFYSPEHERGIRWDDRRFAIPWPLSPAVMSEKDRSHRDFDPGWHLGSDPA